MPDGLVRGMPSPTRGATVIGSGIGELSDRLYKPIGNEIWNDEFSDGSIDPAWTRTDASSSSYVTWKEGGNPGLMSAYHTSSASGNSSWHALSVPLDGATHPLTWEAHITGMVQRNVNYLMSGLAFTDGLSTSGTNQCVFMPFTHANSDSAWRMSLRDFNNWGSNVTSWDEGDWGQTYAGFFARIEYTAANTFRLAMSPDGTSWVKGGSRTCTFTPTHVSLIHTNWGGAVPYVTSWDYARLYDVLDPGPGDSL
jgi:hypothetical protein